MNCFHRQYYLQDIFWFCRIQGHFQDPELNFLFSRMHGNPEIYRWGVSVKGNKSPEYKHELDSTPNLEFCCSTVLYIQVNCYRRMISNSKESHITESLKCHLTNKTSQTYVVMVLLQWPFHLFIFSRPMNVAEPTLFFLRNSTQACAVLMLSTTIWSNAPQAVEMATSYFVSIAPRSP